MGCPILSPYTDTLQGYGIHFTGPGAEGGYSFLGPLGNS